MRAIDADSLYEFFKERRLAEMGRIMGMLKSERFTPTVKD